MPPSPQKSTPQRIFGSSIIIHHHPSSSIIIRKTKAFSCSKLKENWSFCGSRVYLAAPTGQVPGTGRELGNWSGPGVLGSWGPSSSRQLGSDEASASNSNITFLKASSRKKHLPKNAER